MSAPDFYDGVFTDANRTNEASGRSWHIPAESPRRRAFYVVCAVQLIACCVPVILLWVVL